MTGLATSCVLLGAALVAAAGAWPRRGLERTPVQAELYRLWRRAAGPRLAAALVLGAELVAGLVPPWWLEALDRRLAELDWPRGWTAAEWCAASLELGVCLGWGAVVLGGGGTLGVGLALVGMAAPWLALRTDSRRRDRELLAGMPDLLEVVALLVEGGTPPAEAVTAAAETIATGALARQLRVVRAQLATGRSLAATLEHWQERVGDPELAGALAAWRETLLAGGRSVPVLRRQAAALRLRREAELEREAAVAGVRMLGPLLLGFVAVVVLLLAPLAARLGGWR